MALLALCAAPAAVAATANVVQALDFGQWFILNNNGDYTITVAADGSYSHSGSLTQIRAPHPGIYNVTGLPANTVINAVTATQTQAMTAGAGEQMTMDNFDVTAPGSTDGSGAMSVHLGAVAHTSGNGNGYASGAYSGTIQLYFDF
ncbi:MAG: DUF4402 domain-containing protein [Rhodospirillales bacterium]|nr:DUF4402 domain-containing protein [Rhodospirillales bacterium]